MDYNIKKKAIKTVGVCALSMSIMVSIPLFDTSLVHAATVDGITAGIAKLETIPEAAMMQVEETDASADVQEAETAEADILKIGVDALIGVDKLDTNFKRASALQGYTNLGIAHVDNHLNIRAGASENSKLVGKMTRNSACEILEIQGEWTKIKSGNVEGFCKTEFLYMGEEANQIGLSLAVRQATVTTERLKVRAEANTESEVITQVPKGEKLDVIEELGDWTKVALDDEEYYVSSQYVKIADELDTAITMTEFLYGAGVSDVRVSMIEYAKQFLGNRYVYGGTSLTKGTDCSGFTMRIYEKFGISLPRTSREQAKRGTKVSASDVRPGDLYFYGGKGGISHVAMYIGGGQVIHASTERTGIRISNANYRKPVCIKRIIND